MTDHLDLVVVIRSGRIQMGDKWKCRIFVDLRPAAQAPDGDISVRWAPRRTEHVASMAQARRVEYQVRRGADICHWVEFSAAAARRWVAHRGSHEEGDQVYRGQASGADANSASLVIAVRSQPHNPAKIEGVVRFYR